MYGRKRYPSMVWLLVQASIVFCYTSLVFCKPYRQKIHQEENTSNLQNNKNIIEATNNPIEHSVHIDKAILDPSSNSPAQSSDSNKDKLKTNARIPILHESVIFKAVVSNINVLTLQENSTNNGLLPKHFPGKQEHNDANDSHRSDHRESKAHLKWDGHVVAAPLKYDPQVSNFQTPRRVSDKVSTSKMVLSLLTAAAALGSICLTVAIFQCCCPRKRSSSDEDEDQIIDEHCGKKKATLKPVDTHEQTVETESSEKNVHIPQTDTPVETPTGQTTTNGETLQKASEEKEEEEEEQVSVKDKIKAFETQALKPLSPENVEHHRTLTKRPHSRAITDGESESLNSSTTLIMGQVFRKRADTEKCQRKETVSSAAQKVKKDDDYFGVIGRETEVLKSYRRAPAPRNRNKATKALYRKTMPNMDSTERSDMEISMSDWESTVHSFHQTESQFGKQDSKKKKKTPIPLPLPNQNAKDEVDNKLEDSTDGVEKTETKTEETTMEAVSASDTQNLKSAESTENNELDMTSSSGDEASQGEETKIREEMKEDETDKDEKEEVEEKNEEEKNEEEKNEEEEEKNEEEAKKIKKEKNIKEEEERLIKEEKEKEKLKKEAEEKEKLKKEAEEKEEKKLKKEAEEKEEKKLKKEAEEKEEKLKEDEKIKLEKKAKREAEKIKEEEIKEEKMNKDKEQEKKEKEKESEVKKERQLKKEKELKREKDEIKREKEELNKEELKKGKELIEKEWGKAENIFFQIDPTVEPTAAKLVKRDSGHESNETSVQLTESKDDLPKNDESPKSKRHLAHLDRKTMFMLPGQKPEDHMSLMLSLKEKLNDKKEKNELDADTDTKMDVDPEPETEKLEVPEC